MNRPVKLLNNETHKRLLGWEPTPLSAREQTAIYEALEPFNLHTTEDPTEVVNLPLPEWLGHWERMLAEATEAVGRDYLDRLEAALSLEVDLDGLVLPRLPGWWKVSREAPVKVEVPPNGLTGVLDFETFSYGDDWKVKWYPSTASWATDKGIYVWLADLSSTDPADWVEVIPFGRNNVVINHNVQYDRSLLAPEYLLEDSGNRFFDTMAAWIRVRGMASDQRLAYEAAEAAREDGEHVYLGEWEEATAANGLSDVHEFYFGEPLDKGVRDEIVAGGYRYSSQNQRTILEYNLRDIDATLKVYRKLYRELRNTQPEVSFVGQMILGSAWMPLSVSRWPGFLERAEAAREEIESRVVEHLYEVLESIRSGHVETFRIDFRNKFPKAKKDDPAISTWVEKYTSGYPKQLRYLDWTPAVAGATKGLPAWYRALSNKRLTLNSQIVPLLLGVTWRDEPVYPGTIEYQDKLRQTWRTDSLETLPHPEKRGKNVTLLFAKGFISAIEDGVMSASGEGLKPLLEYAKVVNWVALRKRVYQMRVQAPQGYPVYLPQLLVTGTVTGRAADKLSQVMANPKKNRIGTEFKSLFEAPEGYKLVGADVDSQEARIAGLFADTALGRVGSSPLSVVTLIGDKKYGNDIHTLASKAHGLLTRDIAKAALVYATLYGQGQTGATDGMMKALPREDVSTCKTIANNFLTYFKGRRLTTDWGSTRYVGGLASGAFNKMEAVIADRLPRTPVLGCAMPQPLATSREHKTTKINWTIQSSGVDFRDMLLVLMAYYSRLLGIDWRLLLTIHDEVRGMVKDGQERVAAYALQLAHLTVWAAFIDRLGLDAIPANLAWFSAVDVDKVLRKDPYDPQKTLTQPEGLPLGSTLTAKDLLGP